MHFLFILLLPSFMLRTTFHVSALHQLSFLFQLIFPYHFTLYPNPIPDGCSSLEHHQSQISTQLPTLLRGDNKFSMETEDDQMNVENGCIIGEFEEIESEYSSAALDVDICRMRRNRVHREIIESYDQLRIRSENLNQAKQKILRAFTMASLSPVLKSIDGDDKQKDYDRVITTAFNCPYLSYGDDKPVVVLTHGDLLSFAENVRVRGHLGNLLGIPSTKQIFDIPDRYDPVTELTIIDMLHYCLEHADKNLPPKRWTVIKDMFSVSAADIYFVAILMIVFISASLYQVYVHCCLEQQKPKNAVEIVWPEIRHLWLDE